MTRLITAALAATLALAGCDSAPGRPRPDARELAPTEIMAFETLYARNCAGCHGQTGRLGPARALNDPVYLALVPSDRIRQVIAAGVPGTAQPAFALTNGGPLTDPQIDVLVRGFQDRWRRPDAPTGPEMPPYDGGGRPSRQPDSAARGRVVFAGWYGGYGRMVEIDHGMGIHTRYAHLRAVIVQVGSAVAARAQIGIIGSTGRSTGTHIHYEVLVDQRPHDPMKFMRAGEYVLNKD